MYCFACLVLRAYQGILGYSLPKTLSPGVTSGILVISWSLAVLITQATATAGPSCRNASCRASRPRNPTAPLGSVWNLHCTTYVPKAGCMKLPPQALQEWPSATSLLLFEAFDYN